MKITDIIQQARELAAPFRVTNGDKFRLKDVDPAETLQFGSKDKLRAKEALARGVEALAELQDRLFAQDCCGGAAHFQAMDAAGKDGAIKHVRRRASTPQLPGVFLQGAHE